MDFGGTRADGLECKSSVIGYDDELLVGVNGNEMDDVLPETEAKSERSVQKAIGQTVRITRTAFNTSLDKMVLRKNALSEIADYMKTVNRFLNKPSEQKSFDRLIKYWVMQKRLFSRFSSGILLDEESFYSACPEVLSNHIAVKCRCDTIMDPFCGAGGNVIQFTRTCSKVIGIDFDENKIKLAINNATVYGVQNRIEFKTGDYFDREKDLRADVVYMSPPWGGPEYINQPAYSLIGTCANDGGGKRIIEIAREIAPKIVIHLPRNLDKSECVMLASYFDFKHVLFEDNYISHKLNSTTLYLSDERFDGGRRCGARE